MKTKVVPITRRFWLSKLYWIYLRTCRILTASMYNRALISIILPLEILPSIVFRLYIDSIMEFIQCHCCSNRIGKLTFSYIFLIQGVKYLFSWIEIESIEIVESRNILYACTCYKNINSQINLFILIQEFLYNVWARYSFIC